MPDPKGAHLRASWLYINIYFFQNYENVSAEVWKINPTEDVVKAANTRGEPRGPAEQILYDCYVSSFCFIASHPLSKIFQPQVI